jgi:propanediol dehydratase large subunit
VIRSGLLGRLAEALMFAATPLVAAWLVVRSSPRYHTWLVVAAVLSAALFVSFLTHTSAVVSDTEIKVRKGRIPRSEIARVTASADAPALVFRDAEDRIVRILNLTETHVVMMREALRAHGWPEVEAG